MEMVGGDFVKPVTSFTTFGSNTVGTTTQLDNNFLTLKNAVNDLNTYGNYLSDTGGASAMVVTLASNLTGLVTNGLPIQVRVNVTNTGPTVLNYNATGNANVVNMDGSQMTASQLLANSIIQLQYSTAQSAWQLQSIIAASANFASSVTDGSGANLALTVNSAFYTKTQHRVWFTITTTYPVTADGSDAQINGLPFPVNGDVSCSFASNVGSVLQAIAGVASNGSVSIYAAGSFTKTINSALSGKKIYIAGHYTV